MNIQSICGEETQQTSPSPLEKVEEETKNLFEKVVGEKVDAVGDVINQQNYGKRCKKPKGQIGLAMKVERALMLKKEQSPTTPTLIVLLF